MKVLLGDKEIRLVNEDVKMSKKLIREFLNAVQGKAEEKGFNTFYYTLIVVMYIMSNDLIDSLSPDVLAMILNHHADTQD